MTPQAARLVRLVRLVRLMRLLRSLRRSVTCWKRGITHERDSGSKAASARRRALPQEAHRAPPHGDHRARGRVDQRRLSLTATLDAQATWRRARLLLLRTEVAMAYDVARQRVVLFGGWQAGSPALIPALRGRQAYAQGIVVDPMGSFGGLAFTGRLRLVFGD